MTATAADARNLLDDVRTSAAWIARVLNSSGYRADFTPTSLRDVERFMAEHSDHGIAVAGGLLATDLKARLFALGAYLGETVRRSAGGAWETDAEDPHSEVDLTLRLPDDSVIWPVQRVIKRFRHGHEDSIVGYAMGLGMQPSAPPRRRHRHDAAGPVRTAAPRPGRTGQESRSLRRRRAPSVKGMTFIDSVTLDVADTAAARRFQSAAFGLGPQIGLRASEAATSGFRGFTLGLTVSRPADVDSLIGTAVEAGAVPLKPAAKSLWGYGGVVQAPDGTIWKVATSAKRDRGPATRRIDEIVLLLGVADVAASKRFYVERGLTVAKSFGRTYVEFADGESSPVKLALYRRRALAKDLGVSAEGSGSHRLVIGGGAGAFTDPDGFAWEAASPAVTAP